MKKILFLTGTRADYGKIKTLMRKIDSSPNFELYIFVTGMHMLSKYGSTWREIYKDGFQNVYHFVNQQTNHKMDMALSNTILGLSNYVHELSPDLIIVHGDRLEALAGAIVGAFNNIKVAHIEGGEVSGTIDESIRHSITKLSHLHFVSNNKAKKRIIQLGEHERNIFVIGSPDIDVMMSIDLPTIQTVKKHYDIPFENYAIVMYHPVTTEVNKLSNHINQVVNALIESKKKYVVIYPNNDEGSNIILNEYQRLSQNANFKIYPSMRFEYFLTLLKHCEIMIGNSSAGIREAGVYGVPTIDIGKRQSGRYNPETSVNINHVNEDCVSILEAIFQRKSAKLVSQEFGKGNSAEKFIQIIENDSIWDIDVQKQFIDLNLMGEKAYV
ncbi:UDP-N-acetylglucosamine 2-epimerase (hydrolyzing) [Bacillus sp. SLBN-46]|uniref:UDP-N-acetylglucosamine 2-epimerase n=1 Tax=Bacillus sp. SLBN-46 TaxID=3042283 RepID=UPI00285D884A|nr:UDP-N-acetylglucosamine 2-epimerase [Bacillus sp. SLBN-46]MDR6121911.1 UDP-N-acetylglucosamine 2-epimerase (hydrolyzing) [Bacillus sp. SLBN-46]